MHLHGLPLIKPGLDIQSSLTQAAEFMNTLVYSSVLYCLPNNAVKQGDKELEKGGEIPEKLTQRSTELPKLIAVVELIYSRGRTVAQYR